MTTDISYKVADNGQRYRFNYRVAAVIERDGEFLFHRFLQDNFYFLPGGRVGIGETAQEAIIRELKEELDINIAKPDLVFIVENFFGYGDESFHELSMFFKIDGEGLSLPTDEEVRGKVEFRWCDSSGLSDFNLKPEFLKNELRHKADSVRHIVNRSA